ncbi:uncharacterized protein LOC129759158 [Uranotaenia lowii]|uniref:uncharacterized protein LOC129759158 n=1 Tax=Uranotaenia lowii TaxID=190385 RepID=UPI0024793C1A|nr:uncharacterized protein LOC129759158 [Uranotaenia lowii]
MPGGSRKAKTITSTAESQLTDEATILTSNVDGNQESRKKNGKEKETPPTHSCALCKWPDNNEMVMCDACSQWHHYICVDETDGVRDRDWTCAKCLELAEKHSRVHSLAKGAGTNMCEEERQKRLEMLKEKKQLKEKFALKRLELQEKLEEEYLQEKYMLLQINDAGGLRDDEQAKVHSDRDGSVSGAGRIRQWLNEVEEYGGGGTIASLEPRRNRNADRHQPEVRCRVQLAYPNTQQNESTGETSQAVHGSGNHHSSESALQVFRPEQKSTPRDQIGQSRPSENHGQLDSFVLNRSQLAARQGVSKDLPEFNGNPEDWPLFFCTFTSSTAMCGFTNEENMLRLRKCLKGRALDAVRCHLLHPTNVAKVLSTLKMLFGKPETIVEAIKMKIRTLPTPDMDRLETLVSFALSVENLCATIDACEVSDFMYDSSLRCELINKLPTNHQLEWARHARSLTSPKLSDLSSWLYALAEDASSILITAPTSRKSRKGEKYLNVHSSYEQRDESQYSVEFSQRDRRPRENESKECRICKGTCSTVSKCQRFIQMSYEAKWAAVKELHLCKKCLRRHSGICRMQKVCGIDGCSYKHHQLMHKKLEVHAAEVDEKICNLHQSQFNEVLFRIVPVTLYGPKAVVQTYAFLDDGSEITLIEETLADQLELKGPQHSLCLKWTGDTRRYEERSKIVNLRISGKGKPIEKSHNLSEVRTVRELKLPNQSLIADEMKKKYLHLKNIPFESYDRATPRILIGLDHAHLGNATKIREGSLNQPIAIKSRLGWIVFGSCTDKKPASSFVNIHFLPKCECSIDDTLHRVVKDYFSLDSVGVAQTKTLLSTEDQRALELLCAKTRPVGGRYEVGLLWKYENVRLPNSRDMALRRWQCLDRRLTKDENLARSMEAQIKGYLEKGYIRKLTQDEISAKYPRVWYLPIFPVVNPNKPEKLRMVWDAAAKSHGISLNSVLLKGPDQLNSLFSVLLKFREYKTAFSGDIREMYHQVLIDKTDQQCQRFLWKDDRSSSSPSEYIMCVMTFGASCSPSSAQYVKNINAQKFQTRFPEAVDVIINRHYVDDALVSVEMEEDAIRIAKEVYEIHRSGGFEIRNWISNSRRFLNALPGPQTQEKSLSLSSELATEKILGMYWDTASDSFKFKLSNRHDPELLNGDRVPTKREILRTLMMIFDPLGLIGNVLMYLKVILQEIWRVGVGWDDTITDEQFQKWLMWLKVLPALQEIRIPRCFRSSTSTSDKTQVQMHTFVDASESGFAAVVFLSGSTGLIPVIFYAGLSRITDGTVHLWEHE